MLYDSPALQAGDPLDTRMLLSPLQSRGAFDIFDSAIAELNAVGAQIIFGGSSNSVSSGWYQDLMSPLGGIIMTLSAYMAVLACCTYLGPYSVIFRSLDVLFLLKNWSKCDLLIQKLFLDASLNFVNTVYLLDSRKL